MNKKRIYISGQIAHIDIDERRQAFAAAARKWAARGYDVVNPFENGLSQDADWHEHMKIDIHLLTTCDYIYMLRGWEHSKGAKLEMDVASSCGIRVILETTNEESLAYEEACEHADPHDPLLGIDFGDENTPDDFADMNAR